MKPPPSANSPQMLPHLTPHNLIMEHSTDIFSLKLEVLESILYNMLAPVPTLKVQLYFEDQDQRQRFSARYKPDLKQDEEVISGDESEEEVEKVEEDPTISLYGDKRKQHMFGKLEESIILKQHYYGKIASIEKETGTKILIVPKKVKLFGKHFDDIDEAQFQILELVNQISVFTVSKFGREIIESRYCTQKLAEVGVGLGKKGESYYYWYDGNRIPSQHEVNDVVNTVIFKFHKFFSLKLEDQVLQCINPHYLKAISELNAKLFQQIFSGQMNDDYLVEISDKSPNLIIHCELEDQVAIPEFMLKNFYKNLVYFFIVYGSDDDIDNIDQIERALRENGIFWLRNEGLIVIAYNQRANKVNDFVDVGLAVQNSEKVKFLEQMEQIFKMNRDCEIEVPESEFINLDKDQVDPASKKYTIEYRKFDHIWSFIPKNKKEAIFRSILDVQILTPALEKRNKKEQQPEPNPSIEISAISNRINDTSLNGNSLISQDTSLMMGHQLEENKNEAAFNLDKALYSLSQRLTKYCTRIEDTLGKEKYLEDCDKIDRRKKSRINDEFDELILQLTGQKFRSSDVSVPVGMMVVLPEEQIVTVFVRNVEKAFEEEKCPVRLIEKWSSNIGNGWLINTPKRCLQETDDKLVMEPKCLEVIKYLRHIKQ